MVQEVQSRGKRSCIKERVVDFLAQEASAVDADPTLFIIGQSLHNKDIIIGSFQATIEWSRSNITPRAQSHVV